ncbi:MAG TPA: serine/threonine-protein kinase, partial [Herpetosiphonaceae bacterium]
MQCPACEETIKDGSKFCPSCGAGIASATGRIGKGELLQERYRVLRPLARGGMSAVYLAEDRRLGDVPVAVKEMAWGVRPGEQDQYVEAVEQFKREATLLARLQHPNLPRVIDQFETTGKHYLVMDYIAGQTLRDALKEAGGMLPIEQAARWGIELTSVLGYLHRQDPPIIYRDLKPANVMVHPDGRLVLIDFGIARFYKPGQTGDTAHFGTLGYAPAEQYGADQTDARSDIYALGVMLHELLTGYNPASTPFRRPPLREGRPEAPAALEQALIQATADDPRHRWQTMAEFEGGLRRALAQLTGPSESDVATTYIAGGPGAASQPAGR